MAPLYNYATILRAGELDIKSARLKAGMTQKELGKILGVTKQTIINYEKGTTEPSWERLEDIAKALKIDVDELFPYSELGEKKGDLKWAEHLERLANNFQYARMAEEELLLQSLFDYSKFQREVDQKNYTKEQLNHALELESNNTMSDENKIELIKLKYEKDIQKKTDNLIALYKDQSDKELDVIRFEKTDL
ncbi:helix-turn-helix transcriptional regulator [Streptococcus sobrinus]|uniref:helix-turn-helix transcriptional regulator n=1 Tax=Streptococcus sobrinus TaxID=1310 RepID=UPI000300F67D|nr:helix-turn-helix transcriptional regulator [Streptococcus sobrinus]